ncbi:hypothetical protein Hte_002547 [Hypoxylon texense]
MPLDGFIKLGPNIFLYTPPEYQAGRLVVLCTWLGAADKHIAKYADVYRTKAPNAKILLLKSVVGSMISSYSRQRKAMKPAELAVCQVLDECGYLQSAGGTKGSRNKPQILLHLMSNGGANSATNFLVDFNQRFKIRLPLVGLMCDSTPNASSYRKTCRAFMYSFPYSFPLSLVTSAFVHVTITLLYLSIAMGRYEAPEDYWRKSILNAELIENERACYIASKADKMTDWRDVASHAEEARGKGWDVKEIMFDDTPHCNHIGKNKDIYSSAVAAVWEGNKL